MSIFNIFRNKKKADESMPVTEPEESSVPEVPDTVCSTQSLLRELYKHESEHPRDLLLVQSMLEEIREKAAQRTQAEGPLDACAEVIVAPDRMTAYLYLFPAVGEGKDIGEDDILSSLEKAQVTTGIDTAILHQLCTQHPYYCIFPVARGSAPADGRDGYTREHFSRSQEIHLREDSKGNVDHRNLNIFQNIKAGEIICDIYPPEDGRDGTDVLGNVLPAQRGKEAFVPKGKNTRINKEGTALISDIDGDISYREGVFRVVSQLTISQDVDSSVGNLDFAGDILITGDICRGFTVKAGGDVTVYGMVENAMITAGENIDIKKGMNGSGSGTLRAGGNVSSRFLEHTLVMANGNVTAETIINSRITCGGSVLAVIGRGIIIGGTIRASQSVEARKIGTLSNNETAITIGSSVVEEENTGFLTSELEKARRTLDSISKNYRFLTNLPSIPDNKKELFETLTEQKKQYEKLVKELDEKLDTLLHAKPDYRKCHVKSDIIYGITEISLNSSKLIIRDATERCNIYFKENELVLGSF